MPESDCVFCKIVAGELPATIVHQDELTVAFMDIRPATRGHALVVPRRHFRNLLEIANTSRRRSPSPRSSRGGRPSGSAQRA